MSRWTVERSLLPLLDVSLMLLGLFLVMMAVDHHRASQDRSVFAGQSIILIEMAHEGGGFILYATDLSDGKRKGQGRPLREGGQVVREQLRDDRSSLGHRTTVLVQMPRLDPVVTRQWGGGHHHELAQSLDGYRWTLLWGD